MSYDVSLHLIDAKADEREIFERNHTSNTAVMWREAGCDLAEFHDKPAQDLIPSLRTALADMRARPAFYEAWNPPNRWGSYASTVDFLSAILDAAERWPEARVDVCR